jgi:hypothetical protein
MQRLDNGKLPAFTSIGAYTLIYLTTDNDVLCADCANAEENQDSLTQAPFYEGADLYCDGCGASIESSYGDPVQP